MATRVVEWKKPYTWWIAIEVTDDKVINLRLRDENNLIIYDSWDNEIYVDLQLPDEIQPTDAFPVWITTGRVIVDNWWDLAGTIIVAETTSWDNIKILYADEGTLWMDNWTWFRQIYFANEVDALLLALRQYIDEELAKKVNLWPNAVYDQDVVVDLSFWEEVPWWDDECWHNIKLDPKWQIKVYNSTVWWWHEVTIDGLWVEITDNTVLWWDQTAVLNYDGIVYSDTNTNEVYTFKGNNRIARLNDLPDTKTFSLSWASWQTALDEAQAIFDYWNSGKNPIVKYRSSQYYVSRFSDNWTNKFLDFASLNETLYNSVEEWMPKLTIRASSSTNVVNSIDDSWHYRTWEIYTAGSWIDITGNVISSDVISWDAGTTYTIKVANADPASWTPATTITFVL